MELIDVQPQDFMFLFGITLTDLKKLKLILDNMQFNYDSTKKEHIEAKTYLEEKFYPRIIESMESVNGTKPNSPTS